MIEQYVQQEFPFTKKGAAQKYAIDQNYSLNILYCKHLQELANNHKYISKKQFYSSDLFYKHCKEFREINHDKYFREAI